jgi:RES domain-containing protein
LRRYVFFRAEIPETFVSEVSDDDLPGGWDRHPPSSPSQRVGDRWVSSGESVALKVPSDVVPYSNNCLLSPAHPSFNEVEVGPGEVFPVNELLLPDR